MEIKAVSCCEKLLLGGERENAVSSTGLITFDFSGAENVHHQAWLQNQWKKIFKSNSPQLKNMNIM
jgi:hypothetical protein